jgi:hypothetical protein
MSTIVYKEGILAGDTAVSFQDQRFGKCKKIFDLEDKTVGIVGALCLFPEFIKFIEGKEFNKEIFKEEKNNFEAVVIDKITKKTTTYDKSLSPEEVEADFICFGSGASLAKGALLMGATPKQAIECAAKIDVFTNNEIQEIIC